jgi:hypothetical protein
VSTCPAPGHAGVAPDLPIRGAPLASPYVARLRLAWCCYHKFWLRRVIHHLLLTQRLRGPHHLLTRGPLGLLTQALHQHGLEWADLANDDYAPTEGVPASKDPGLRAWKKMCRQRVHERVAEWAVKAGAYRPKTSPIRAHFPRDKASAVAMIRGGLPPSFPEGVRRPGACRSASAGSLLRVGCLAI